MNTGQDRPSHIEIGCYLVTKWTINNSVLGFNTYRELIKPKLLQMGSDNMCCKI